MSAATIIFFDIAGYSKKSTAQQRELRRSLTEWVRSELRALPSPAAENVIKHPAGDGMLLAFLHQEENPWRNDVLLDFIVGLHQWACAETARGCNDDVRVRMGVHVGQIDIDVDVNGTRSVVGTTVNDTQRIMDAANPRQTLFSEAFIREYFGLQLRLDFQARSAGTPRLQGEFKGPFAIRVKHGLIVSLYQLVLGSGDAWWTNAPPPGLTVPPTPARLATSFLAIFAIHLTLTMSWMVALLLQKLPDGVAPEGYASFKFCLLHYPHLSIYPIVFGWPVVFCLWKATAILWRLNFRSQVAIAACAACLFAVLGTRQDAVGDYMMLHEFAPEVQVRGISGERTLVDFKPYSEVLAQIKEYKDDPQAAATKQSALSSHFSYEATWGKLSGWESSARPFYLLLVFYIEFLLFYIVALSAASWAVARTRTFNERQSEGHRYLFYLLMAMAALLIWVPFRIYYNVTTKGPLFGLAAITDNTFSRVFSVPSLGLTPSEFVPGSLALIFLYTIIAPFAMPKGDRSTRLRYVFGFTLLILLGFGFLASHAPQTFCDLVGIEAPPIALIARGILLGFYIMVSYELVNLQPSD